MKKWNLVIDIEKCENCNNCFLACKDEHVGNDWPGYAAEQPDHGHYWMKLTTKERGQYPIVDVAYLPQPCMHCDNAPCIKASGGAIYQRPDGIVIIDPVKSKGQKKLMGACPYGSIWWNEKLDIPQKCTMCAHLLDSGWQKTRCVQSCPTGALSLQHVEDEEMQRIAKAEKLEALMPERRTAPRVYYKNLYRFFRCFIAGSIAVTENGQEECAAGAKATLSDAAGKVVAEVMADNFGDFKFDNLAPDSGNYSIDVSYPDRPMKKINVELKDSISTGVINL